MISNPGFLIGGLILGGLLIWGMIFFRGNSLPRFGGGHGNSQTHGVLHYVNNGLGWLLVGLVFAALAYGAVKGLIALGTDTDVDVVSMTPAESNAKFRNERSLPSLIPSAHAKAPVEVETHSATERKRKEAEIVPLTVSPTDGSEWKEVEEHYLVELHPSNLRYRCGDGASEAEAKEHVKEMPCSGRWVQALVPEGMAKPVDGYLNYIHK